MTTTVTVGRLRECVSAVLPHVQIDDVHVVRLECWGGHPVVDGPFDVDTSVLVKAEQRGGNVDAYSLYTVSAAGPDGADAWNLRLEMVGVWRADDATPAFDDEHLNCFALAIGSMTLHPYAREVVQNAVSRLGYPPFTLDMITPPTGGQDDETIEIESAT